jgi:hypothetical protein
MDVRVPIEALRVGQADEQGIGRRQPPRPRHVHPGLCVVLTCLTIPEQLRIHVFADRGGCQLLAERPVVMPPNKRAGRIEYDAH